MQTVAAPIEINPNVLYTPAELAGYLKLDSDTLKLWRTTDRYPALKYKRVGGSVRYLGADILSFLAQDPDTVKAQADSYPEPKPQAKPRRRPAKKLGSRRRRKA
jgi:hypothetical protein